MPSRAHVTAGLLRLASDERLAAQVGTGSETAFEAIFDRYHRPVLGFCRHMLGSREEAEDAVQHTFMAAYRDLSRSGKTVVLRPWLYTIARNYCVSQLRARRGGRLDDAAEPARDQLASEVIAREDLRAVLGDVARLPHDQRAALILAEVGDLSHEEISRILDCPRHRVKALVFQARSSLVAGRAARDTPCAVIREQLATLRGAALRRATLRRHLHDCPGCRAFAKQMRDQRRALGLLLPVAPSVGLKRAVLGAVFGSGGGSAVVSGGVLSTGALAVAALVVVAVPGGGAPGPGSGSRDGHGSLASAVTTPAASGSYVGSAPVAIRVDAALSTRRKVATRRSSKPSQRPQRTRAGGIERRRPGPAAGESRTAAPEAPSSPPAPHTPAPTPVSSRPRGPARPSPPAKTPAPGKPAAPGKANPAHPSGPPAASPRPPRPAGEGRPDRPPAEPRPAAPARPAPPSSAGQPPPRAGKPDAGAADAAPAPVGASTSPRR